MTMPFSPGKSPPSDGKHDERWFVLENGRLLVRSDGDDVHIPDENDLRRCNLTPQRPQYLGTLDSALCYAAEVTHPATLPEGFEFRHLRSLFTRLEEELLWIAGRANQLVHWQRTHIYCGACGNTTIEKKDERARLCPKCGLINYPRLSPAVIVAVLKDDKILLARNKRFKVPIYSVLAGFVEPGETLEQCVEREVKEETGIDVKNIRYFGSQPWPFPDSLMVAFTAEYAGGKVAVDKNELMDAGWYTKGDLPQIPPPLSIAGQLIAWFCRR